MRYKTMNAFVGQKDILKEKGYIFEPKLDGVRALCFIQGNKCKFVSRSNRDITLEYELENLKPSVKTQSCILDGEVIAFNGNGRPTLHALRKGSTPEYVIFDILMLNGKSLTHLPLLERKKILEKIVKDTKRAYKIMYTPQGKALWSIINKNGLEGVMAKQDDSKYYPGERKNVWLKIKQKQTVDCIIIGYTVGKRAIRSLALGLWHNKKIHYLGMVGTGFSQDQIAFFSQKLPKLAVDHLPIINEEQVRSNIIWVKPMYVAEIAYFELTPYGILRMASYQDLRLDKKLNECTVQEQLPELLKRKFK